MTTSLGRIRSTIERDDILRSNLFRIELPNILSDNINGIPEFNDFGLFDIIRDEVVKRTDAIEKITSFVSPSILRTLGLGDLLDTAFGALESYSFYCRGIEMPQRQITTERAKSIRPYKNVPTIDTWQDISISCLTEPKMKLRNYFLYWMSLVVNPNTGTHGYYDSYAKPVVIKSYYRNGSVSTQTIVEEAYPVFVGPLSFDYNSNDTLAEFQVTLTYRNATTIGADRELNILGELIGLGRRTFGIGQSV